MNNGGYPHTLPSFSNLTFHFFILYLEQLLNTSVLVFKSKEYDNTRLEFICGEKTLNEVSQAVLLEINMINIQDKVRTYPRLAQLDMRKLLGVQWMLARVWVVVYEVVVSTEVVVSQ